MPPSSSSSSTPPSSTRPPAGRKNSLLLSEHAFHDAAVHAEAHAFRDGRGVDVDAEDPNVLGDTDRMASVARAFLERTCPEFLEALGGGEGSEGNRSATDRLVKVGRNVSSTMRAFRRRSSEVLALSNVDGEDDGGDDTGDGASAARASSATAAAGVCVLSKAKADASLSLLAEECRTLAGVLNGTEARRVPKVRFGRTELQMPVLTLGCMRFQQSWNRSPDASTHVTTMGGVKDECQSNLSEILRYAVRNGVNHIETAKMYGCSEMQIGHALRELLDAGETTREDLIVQTKGGISSTMTPDQFRAQFLGQLELLRLEYVDLFSVHGLNTDAHLEWLFDHPNGPEANLYPVLTQLRAEGKLRHVGFSTHGRADLIRRAIDTDAFDYVNLHYHFVGSYTASGDSVDGVEGNLSNVRLARSKDMGVFVISPYDKGGRLYAPSQRLRDLTLPDMEPMTYGSVWLWQHGRFDAEGAPVHTIVCGAARPSDLDQPILASFLLEDEAETSAKRERIARRLKGALEDVLGEEFASKWHRGLPNSTNAEQGTQHGNIVWMHNVVRAFGLLDFAKERYGMLTMNGKLWDPARGREDNMKAASPAWPWCPGTAYDTTLAEKGEYDEDWAKSPEELRDQIREAERLAHLWCAAPEGDANKEEEKKEAGEGEGEGKEEDESGSEEKGPKIPLEWETSYDMRPWTAYPERE